MWYHVANLCHCDRVIRGESSPCDPLVRGGELQTVFEAPYRMSSDIYSHGFTGVHLSSISKQSLFFIRLVTVKTRS